MQETIKKNINNSFFQGSYKEVWKRLNHPALAEAEADFIEDVCGLKKGAKGLDIMCGYGRHSILLAKRGYKLTAIDNSKEYIEEIKAVAQKEALDIKMICADVAETELDDTYNAVICMGNSFAFFDKNTATGILKNISAHLQTGGKFIINTWMIAEIAIKYFKEKEWYAFENFKYLIDNKFFFHPSRIESEHIIIQASGDEESIKGVDYIFTIAELEAMLETAGFRLEEIYATPRKKKFILGDTRAYIVAEKIAQ